MSNTLKRAAELLRHQADKLAPLTNVQAVMDHKDELDSVSAELERMAQVEPVNKQLLVALKMVMEMDVRGYRLRDRMQFSEAGRSILYVADEAIAAAESAK